MQEYLALIKLFSKDPSSALLARKLKRQGTTFLGYSQLLSLVNNFHLVKQRYHGRLHIAEFGVGRGGSATLFAHMINKYGGHLYLFDVFGRIPPPTELDGLAAKKRYDMILTRESPAYYGNIPDLLDLLKVELTQVCSENQIHFFQGRYEELLPTITEAYGFHLVHIDCDWYTSTKSVLSFLKKNIFPGAVLQIDDYLTWAGSKRAVDDAAWLNQYATWMVGAARVIDLGTNVI
jgi:O-methyltransferase